MINVVFDNFLLVMQRGGWVMWPLLVLMVTAGTLVMERLYESAAAYVQIRRNCQAASARSAGKCTGLGG